MKTTFEFRRTRDCDLHLHRHGHGMDFGGALDWCIDIKLITISQNASALFLVIHLTLKFRTAVQNTRSLLL